MKDIPIDVSRLGASIRSSRMILRRSREEFSHAVQQYVGKHWAEEGSRERVPVNMIALYIQIMTRSMVSKNPRAMLSTFLQQHKPIVTAMQSWANKEIVRMNLASSLQRVVMGSLFGFGVMKVALAKPTQAAGTAWSLAAGQPFAEDVDLDDWFMDFHAKRWGHLAFSGHRYRVPKVAAEDLYKRKFKDVPASSDEPYNLEGDQKIHMLGRGYYGADQEEMEDMVDLWEVYLPRHRVVLTLSDETVYGPEEGDVLEQVPWIGPDCGPYYPLFLQEVPGNLMPKGPVQDLVDLHEAVNRGYRKTIRMLDRIKELTVGTGAADKDLERTLNASDGEVIRMDRPESVKQVTYGGQAARTVLGASMELKNLFTYMAGNLDAAGGLAAQSKTATQDEMLQESASRGIEDFQQATVKHAAAVIKGLCWYWHHDPANVMQVYHPAPGLGEVGITRQVGPKERGQVKFEDLEVEVNPYSMRYQTPQSRMAVLNQVVTQIVIPMGQLLAQQQKSFDIEAYLKKVSLYMDTPDISDVVTIGPAVDMATQSPAAPMKPPVSSRKYIRENRSSQTKDASERNIASQLMDVQPGGNGDNPSF